MKKVSLSSSKTKFSIAFVGNYQYSSGSSNALLGYVRAGEVLGYDIRVSSFGYVDDVIKATVPVADRNWRPDLFIIVFESYPFLTSKDVEDICALIPRSKRIIIDPDGKYSKPSFSAGDTNHLSQDSYKFWANLYDSLSDIILQPYPGTPITQKVKSFLYFGIDKNVVGLSKQPKDYDLMYIGNNWYRWHDIYKFVQLITPIRNRLKKVALVGNYWSSDVMLDYEEATYSDPNFLNQNGIEILKSAPYGKVEETMSRSLLNPIFVRPILNHLGFVTPRMFETFNADTVPLVPYYFTHATRLYGKEIINLTMSDNPEDIIKILDNYDTYLNLSREIREMLKVKHSYEIRLNELVKFAQ